MTLSLEELAEMIRLKIAETRPDILLPVALRVVDAVGRSHPWLTLPEAPLALVPVVPVPLPLLLPRQMAAVDLLVQGRPKKTTALPPPATEDEPASPRKYADATGDVEVPPLPKLSRCEQAILDLLDSDLVRRRGPEIVTTLESEEDDDKRFQESTTRAALAHLGERNLGLLNIRKDKYGDGYGRTEWG